MHTEDVKFFFFLWYDTSQSYSKSFYRGVVQMWFM